MIRRSPPLSSGRAGSTDGGGQKVKERRVEYSPQGNISPLHFANFRKDSLLDFWDFWRRAAEPERTAPEARRTGKKKPLSALYTDLGSSDGSRWGEVVGWEPRLEFEMEEKELSSCVEPGELSEPDGGATKVPKRHPLSNICALWSKHARRG